MKKYFCCLILVFSALIFGHFCQADIDPNYIQILNKNIFYTGDAFSPIDAFNSVDQSNPDFNLLVYNYDTGIMYVALNPYLNICGSNPCIMTDNITPGNYIIVASPADGFGGGSASITDERNGVDNIYLGEENITVLDENPPAPASTTPAIVGGFTENKPSDMITMQAAMVAVLECWAAALVLLILIAFLWGTTRKIWTH